MSASLVYQSLELVDKEFREHRKQKGNTESKVGSKIKAMGKKLNVVELKKRKKLEQKAKEDKKKLKQVMEAQRIQLDKAVMEQIIKRAITKRPVKLKKQKKEKVKETVFTEEDFKKFEEEYFG